MTEPRSDELPEPIRAAFTNRAFVSFREAAGLLEIHVKTLRRHCEAGDVVWHQRGLGIKIPRRVFTLADMAETFNRLRRSGPCHDNVVYLNSSATSARRSGSTISSLPVGAGRGRPVNVTKRKRKPSSKKSGAMRRPYR
jgi:hypothetical protein